MTKNETLELLAIIKVAYPQKLGKISELEAGAMVELWANTFAGVPKPIMQIAVKKIVMQTKFFPSIAEMCEVLDDLNRDAYAKLTHGKYNNELSTAEMMHDHKLHEAELEAYENCEDKDKFSRYEFKTKWRDENPFDREQYRAYDEQTERNLEFIMHGTADFAETKCCEYRAGGQKDFLLTQCQGNQMLGNPVIALKGGNRDGE